MPLNAVEALLLLPCVSLAHQRYLLNQDTSWRNVRRSYWTYRDHSCWRVAVCRDGWQEWFLARNQIVCLYESMVALIQLSLFDFITKDNVEPSESAIVCQWHVCQWLDEWDCEKDVLTISPMVAIDIPNSW